MRRIRTCISLLALIHKTAAFSVGGRQQKCAFSTTTNRVAYGLPSSASTTNSRVHSSSTLQMNLVDMDVASHNNNDLNRSGLFGKVVQIRHSVMQKLQRLLNAVRLRQSLQTFVLAAALFFAVPNTVQASSSSSAAAVVSGSATATKMVSATAVEQPGYKKLPGGKSYVQKYMFSDDEYNPFEAGMREEPGDIFYNDGVTGRGVSKSNKGAGAGVGGISSTQMKMYRGMLLKILPAVALPLVAPRIWKIITNFSEILTYGKEAVENTTYDAIEKKSDEDGGGDDDDIEDEDWYDPNNPDDSS